MNEGKTATGRQRSEGRSSVSLQGQEGSIATRLTLGVGDGDVSSPPNTLSEETNLRIDTGPKIASSNDVSTETQQARTRSTVGAEAFAAETSSPRGDAGGSR